MHRNCEQRKQNHACVVEKRHLASKIQSKFRPKTHTTLQWYANSSKRSKSSTTAAANAAAKAAKAAETEQQRSKAVAEQKRTAAT